MPDGEALFRGALAAQFDQTADPNYPYTDPAGAVYVCTELPDNLDTLARVIHVHALPGGRRFTLTTPGISVDCIASGANARTLARTLANVVDGYIVWQLQRSVVAGVPIGQIQTVSTPAERPYVNTALRRFGMTYRPTLRDIA